MHEGFLNLLEARLHFRTTGRGPLLVLLHGGPGIYDYLGDSVLAGWLAGRRTVCAYDQRGCRQSDSDGPFTLAANVEDLEALRQHLQADCLDLVGHSWGGLLAAAYAAAYPQQVGRIVLMNSIGTRGGWSEEFARNLAQRHDPAQRQRLAEIDAEIARCPDAQRRNALYQERFNTALPSYMAARFRDRAPVLACYARAVHVQTMNTVLEGYAQRSLERGLEHCAAPVLIVHGREDPVPLSILDQLRETFPHAEVALLDNCGHFPWLEQPEALRSILLGFLPQAGDTAYDGG